MATENALRKQIQDAYENCKALAIKGQFSLEKFFGEGLQVIEDEVWKELEEVNDMEGIKPRLPQIKIKHQAEMWEFSDGTKTEEFMAIILDSNLQNAWWEIGFDESGGGTIPDCFSLNGNKCSPDSAQPQSEFCAKEFCLKNRYGSDGRGKACKNGRRVHVLIPQSAMPQRIILPPANLEPYGTFVTEEVAGKRLKLLTILVKFQLVKQQNQDGIEYSEIALSVVKDDLGRPVVLAKTKEQIKTLLAFRNEWLEAMRGQDILSDELHDEFITPEYTGSENSVGDVDAAEMAGIQIEDDSALPEDATEFNFQS